MLYTFLVSLIISARAGTTVQCPNDEFGYIQSKGQTIQFRQRNTKIRYLSYGGAGFWSIEVVRPLPSLKQPVLCDQTTFAEVLSDRQDLYHKAQQLSFANDNDRKESLAHVPQSCCVRPLHMPQAANARYDVLPSGLANALQVSSVHQKFHEFQKNDNDRRTAAKAIELDLKRISAPGGQLNFEWLWMEMKPPGIGISIYNLLRIPQLRQETRDTHSFCTYALSQLGYNVKGYKCRFPKVANPEHKIGNNGVVILPDEFAECYPSASRCDTGNVLTITAFILHRETDSRLVDQLKNLNFQFIRFCFSESGVFNAQDLFKDFTVLSAHGWKIRYASLPIFSDYVLGGNVDGFKVEVDPKWELASTCAACPAHSVSITMSEKKAVFQKKRIKNAMSLKLSVGTGKMLPVKGAAGIGYTRSVLNEVGESLSSGTATTIKANCNAFYLYHFSVSINSWGGGDNRVSTRYFYCTDRRKAPTCIPRGVVEKNDAVIATDASMHKKFVCNNYDTPMDWGQDAENPSQPAWRSMHSGRPKPINLDPWKVDKHKSVGGYVMEKDGAVKQNFITSANSVANSKATTPLHSKKPSIGSTNEKKEDKDTTAIVHELEKEEKERARDNKNNDEIEAPVSGSSTKTHSRQSTGSGLNEASNSETGDAMQEELNFMEPKMSINTGMHRRKNRKRYRKSRLLSRDVESVD